jgi:hypothetical protein
MQLKPRHCRGFFLPREGLMSREAMDGRSDFARDSLMPRSTGVCESGIVPMGLI